MTYYETFNVLAFHFIYRYRAIVQGKFHGWTINVRLGHWLSLAAAFLIAHSSLTVWAMSYSSVTNAYSPSLNASTFISLYGVNTSDPTIGYVAIEFRRLNHATGLEEYDASTFVTFAVIMALFGFSSSVMVFCSVSIIEPLKNMNVSTAMISQQRLFFRSLLVQTLIPCVFSYLPVCVIWLLPLFTCVALGPFGNILIMITALYPSVDANMIILFIPAY
ncbi:hypothetical protein PENTCL1PPCAC_14465, partial [Pristionchus entomophagus]